VLYENCRLTAQLQQAQAQLAAAQAQIKELAAQVPPAEGADKK
jgi:multidrug resistance efflux pump